MNEEYYSTDTAARYLELSIPTLKHHIYTTKRLIPDGKIGHNLIFYRATLDAFKLVKPNPGRPKGNPDENEKETG